MVHSFTVYLVINSNDMIQLKDVKSGQYFVFNNEPRKTYKMIVGASMYVQYQNIRGKVLIEKGYNHKAYYAEVSVVLN